jgi:hypothetical protein
MIARCQSRLLALAEHFSEGEGSAWQLLPFLGLGLHSEHVRLDSRRQLLQLSSGVLGVFELRFSGPPYTLAWLAFEHVDQAPFGNPWRVRANHSPKNLA